MMEGGAVKRPLLYSIIYLVTLVGYLVKWIW